MRLNSKQIAEFTGATVIVEALDPSQLALGITWDRAMCKRISSM